MRRTVQAMLVVAILLDVAYWSIWFTQRDWIASEHTQAYYDFENAFPLADLWLGIACVLALVTLTRRHESALFWLLCAGQRWRSTCSRWTSSTTSSTASSPRVAAARSRP